MAENKKGFLLYADLIHTIEKMPDEKAGKLLKHILAYVNDLNPVSDDLVVELVFEPIKQTLKRDLQKYREIVDRNRENGKKGGRPTKPTETQNNPVGFSETQVNPEKHDSDSDNDIDSDIDKDLLKQKKLNKKSLEERQQDFYNELLPFVEKYTKETIRAFYDHFSEATPDKMKMKKELNKTWETSKRLATWKRNESKFNKDKQPQQQPSNIYKAKTFTGYED